MKTSLPFKTLDAYNNECANLYAVAQSLLGYPNISEDDVEDLDGKLYALAFIYICSDYLNITIEQHPYEDFDELVKTMNFEYHEEEVATLAKTYTQDPDDLESLYAQVWVLKVQYRKKISKDLKNLFGDNDIIGKFFAAIFLMNDGEYMPDIDLGTIDFLDNNF